MKPCTGLSRCTVDLRGNPGERGVGGDGTSYSVFSMHANAPHRVHTHITFPRVYLRTLCSSTLTLSRSSSLPNPSLSQSLSLYLCIYYMRVCVRAAAALTAPPIRILLVLRINLLSCRVSFGVYRILPHRKEIFARTTIRVPFDRRSDRFSVSDFMHRGRPRLTRLAGRPRVVSD